MFKPTGYQWLAIALVVAFVFTAESFAATRAEITSTPTLIATPIAKPVISKVDAGICVTKAQQFKVAGTNFGSSSTRTLALKAGAMIIPATIVSWSEKSSLISAKLPTSSSIKVGQTYPVIIIQKSNKQVLSNSDKQVKVCALKASLAVQQPARAELKLTPAQTSEQSEETASVPLSSSGSLIGGLPQPSFIPEIKEEQDASYEAGELVIISNDMEKALALENMAAEQGHRIKRRRTLKGLGFIISVIGLAQGTKVSDALKQFQQLDKNLLVDANHRYAMQDGNKDTHNPKIHKSIGWGKISKTCGKGIKIGVIDSLADTGYQGFGPRQIVNKSLLSLGVKPANKEHATAIASIIAGQPGTPVMGLLPGSKVYVAGVFRKSKDKRVDTTAELIINGLNWLREQNVHVVNLSIAGPRNLLLEVGVKRLLEQNVLIAAAVGNDGLMNVSKYPAAIKGVVAVTAVDARNRIYKKANSGNFVVIAAPGVDIWAARGARPPGFVSGTSYATPYVTASLALLRQRHPGLPVNQVTSQLTEKTKDLGKSGMDITFGNGLLQFKGCS